MPEYPEVVFKVTRKKTEGKKKWSHLKATQIVAGSNPHKSNQHICSHITLYFCRMEIMIQAWIFYSEQTNMR